ncbi:MAG: apolipoprotein N-acyltransferase [Deltaproteobacteria bacterium]|nr:apolipoprotein N-acyltransferase [Deltaproteobacteria bacterium]
MARAAHIAGAAIASALAFALYARVGWPWFALGWVGLTPWLAALDRSATLGGALAAGLAMSLAFTLAVFPWFVGAIAGYADAPWAVGLLVVLLTAPLIQPQFLTFAAARWLARRRRLGCAAVALSGAGVYVGSEWLLPKLFADTLGHGFLASAHLRQAADLVGAHGLTVVLLLANDAALLAWRSRHDRTRRRAARRAAIAVALLVGAMALYGTLRLQQFADGGGDAPVVGGLVQADISHYDQLARAIGTYDAVREILDAHVALSTSLLQTARPDFLVWPETVYPTTYGAPKSPAGAEFDAAIAAFVADADVPLVFGSYDVEAGREYNAAFALAPRRDAPLGIYRKALLFPFTERVPAWLDRPALRAALPWLGTWQPGGGRRTLDLPLAGGRRLRVAPLICYDAVDPSIAIAAVRDGAELLLALSNDSWFADGNGPRLHLVVAAFRSIETRRPQLRATNTGISASIDASGELIETLAVHRRGTLAARLRPEREARTLMLAWGDWFPPAMLGLGLAALCTRPGHRVSRVVAGLGAPVSW